MTENLKIELQWLQDSLQKRLGNHVGGESSSLMNPPGFTADDAFRQFVEKHELIQPDRLLLILALAVHLDPGLLDRTIKQGLQQDGDHVQLGGTRSSTFRGLLPTAETFLFIVAGTDLESRLKAWEWLRKHSVLIHKGIVQILKPQSSGDPLQSGILSVDNQVAEEIIFGESAPPAFSMEFPARMIETNLEWKDLVLAKQTRSQLDELKDWLEKRDELQSWAINKHVKDGYRSLFYGPPGTGKTLAANLLGKYTNTQVFLVDLSLVVSKYIGETEKNLSALFNQAKNKNWILFFDEADALFGKRTNVRDAHDKYANQEVSYLLQRVEEFPGLVILASNLKGNIDEAFLRRFQSVIHFPMPGPAERFSIWKNVLRNLPGAPKHEEVKRLSHKFELSGANIVNAAHFASLKAVSGSKKISKEELLNGIKKEISKEGNVI